MSRLKLKAYENIVMVSNMQFESPGTDLDASLDLVDDYSSLLAYLDETGEEDALVADTVNQNNEIYFYEDNGKIPFLETLDKVIPVEMYDQVKNLLLEMQRGVFKTLKYLFAWKFFEVRSDELRVMFVRIGPNQFLIINIFLKKILMSSLYLNQMQDLGHTAAYAQKEYMRQLQEEDIQEKHAKYLNDIITFCDTKGRSLQ